MTSASGDDRPPDPILVDALAARLDRFKQYAAKELAGWIEAEGLSVIELHLFLGLADGEARGGAELADAAGLSVESSYKAVHKLAQRGWLAEEDRRHSLNALGRAKSDELTAYGRKAVEGYLASLSPSEREELASALIVR